MSISRAIDEAFGTSVEAESRGQRNARLQWIKEELGLYPELTSEPFDDVMDEQELRARVENCQMARSFVSLLVEFLSYRRDTLRGMDPYSRIRFVAVYDAHDVDPDWIRNGSVDIEEYAEWFDGEVLDHHRWINFEICGVEDGTLYVRNILSIDHWATDERPTVYRSSIDLTDTAMANPANQIGKSGEELHRAQEAWRESNPVDSWFGLTQRFGRPGPKRVRQYPDPDKLKEFHPQPVYVETVGDGDDEAEGILEEIGDPDPAIGSVEELEPVVYEELPELESPSDQDEDE